MCSQVYLAAEGGYFGEARGLLQKPSLLRQKAPSFVGQFLVGQLSNIYIGIDTCWAIVLFGQMSKKLSVHCPSFKSQVGQSIVAQLPWID